VTIRDRIHNLPPKHTCPDFPNTAPAMPYSIHCTKKLLDRIKPEAVTPSSTSSTVLGHWYATALFWKPQAALLVNERTLLPVLMPLAPASTLAERFCLHLEDVLAAHGTPQSFIEHELSQMNESHYAKTVNRSVVGVMNQLAFMAEVHRDHHGMDDLLALSMKLAEVPCSPLYKSTIAPNGELARVVSVWSAAYSAQSHRFSG
jgi:hypothetical protein